MTVEPSPAPPLTERTTPCPPTRPSDTAEADDATEAVDRRPPTSALDDGDPVTTLVERVRPDLAARRADGSLPRLPPDELARQFSAVVEAADSGVIDAPPLDPGRLAELATLPSRARARRRPV